MNLLGREIYNTGHRHGVPVTVEDLDAIVEAFEAMKHYGALPVKVQHAPVNDLRFGRVENPRRKGDVLLADLINVPNGLEEKHRFISAETETPFQFNGRTFKRRLTAVSLTDRPGCYGIADVFGNRTNELVFRPTGEHGFESFRVENEETMFMAETCIPNAPGDEYELVGEASGHGVLSLGYVGHDEDGNMTERFYRAAGGALIGGKRGFSGRIGGGDFAMVAPAFEARTTERMEVDYLTIRKIEQPTVQHDYISVRKLTPFRTVTFDPEITAQSNWLYARAAVFNDVSAIGVNSTNQWAVQSITNVNIRGEYSVLPLATSAPLSSHVFMLAERFRPDFHPRMPSSGAYAANARVLVTSFDDTGVVTFLPGLVAYTRTGSATAFFRTESLTANVRPGSSDPSLPLLPSNQWIDFAGTINVGSHGDVNPASGPYFVAPAMSITNGANEQEIMSSSWIALLNVTAGNP